MLGVRELAAQPRLDGWLVGLCVGLLAGWLAVDGWLFAGWLVGWPVGCWLLRPIVDVIVVRGRVSPLTGACGSVLPCVAVGWCVLTVVCYEGAPAVVACRPLPMCVVAGVATMLLLGVVDGGRWCVLANAVAH